MISLQVEEFSVGVSLGEEEHLGTLPLDGPVERRQAKALHL
jgi:hypothetical protein